VLFAHGSGSSRHSPRNRLVARVLREAGSGTLLFDLLTPEEEAEDALSGHLRFNIDFLAERLVAATRWLSLHPVAARFPVGSFGSSTGGAAALAAAATLGPRIEAVVSRGGRSALAMEALPRVRAATLLIVGERDELVLRLNRQAFDRISKVRKTLPSCRAPRTCSKSPAPLSKWPSWPPSGFNGTANGHLPEAQCRMPRQNKAQAPNDRHAPNTKLQRISTNLLIAC
jgi:pimeloyl-ACP methyl ester carboxylesterase